jgi:DNA invertase Pin-like site-specific DNA recombinase
MKGTKMTVAEMIHALDELTKAGTLQRNATDAIDIYVQRARNAGASWSQIGRALEITRQTAWERFNWLDGAEEEEAPTGA